MKIEIKKCINALVNDAVDDIVTTLEEDRFYPSEKQAGTAPMESAVDHCGDVIRDLIDTIGEMYGVVNTRGILKPMTFDEILKQANDENVELFNELEEVECYDRDHCQKYVYVCTVYKHKNEHRFLEISMKCSANRKYSDFDCAREVSKKETVTYEWT